MTWKSFGAPAFIGVVMLWMIVILWMFMPAIIQSIRAFLRGEPTKTLRDQSLEEAERGVSSTSHSLSAGDSARRCPCDDHQDPDHDPGRHYGW